MALPYLHFLFRFPKFPSSSFFSFRSSRGIIGDARFVLSICLTRRRKKGSVAFLASPLLRLPHLSTAPVNPETTRAAPPVRTPRKSSALEPKAARYYATAARRLSTGCGASVVARAHSRCRRHRSDAFSVYTHIAFPALMAVSSSATQRKSPPRRQNNPRTI